jgi:hypothetical protein
VIFNTKKQMMKKVIFMAGLIWTLSSCGDDRDADAGAGNTDNAAPNTTVGTGDGGATFDGGSDSALNGTNSTNGINGGNTTGLDTSGARPPSGQQ